MTQARIFLTLDYELFFGQQPGSAQKCILEPTEKLREICRRTGAHMTFFIDAGYLWQLGQNGTMHPELLTELEAVSRQIQGLVSEGHDCQLHIHPHWEDARYAHGGWVFDVSRYKLSDFSKAEATEIFDRYAETLQRISGQSIHSYRAGGWCLQPFAHIKECFEKWNIQVDSTVFPGGHNQQGVYDYDFRSVDSNRPYRFTEDVVQTEASGSFLELPIAAHTYSPLFFWQLYGWGRLIPSRHKPIGDGYPIATSGERTHRLSKKSRLSVSMDGFFARELSAALKRNSSPDFVVIGHPKACTLYSLEQLEKFIVRASSQHRFMTFSERLNEVR